MVGRSGQSLGRDSSSSNCGSAGHHLLRDDAARRIHNSRLDAVRQLLPRNEAASATAAAAHGGGDAKNLVVDAETIEGDARGLRLMSVGELDEGVALGFSRARVGDDAGGEDVAVGGEEGAKFLRGEGGGNVVDDQVGLLGGLSLMLEQSLFSGRGAFAVLLVVLRLVMMLMMMSVVVVM